MSKLTKSALDSELSALENLLKQGAEYDPLGSLSLRQRANDVKKQLATLAVEKHYADVTLLFYGRPVDGSKGIDAEFAGKALQSYQATLSKHMNSLIGRGLGRRGPIPERNLSKMNIVDVVHGSFGFQLQEDNDEVQMFDTSLREAVHAISGILSDIVSPSEEVFESAIDSIDSRTFLSVKGLIELLRKEEAMFKIIEDDDEKEFDSLGIDRAYQRLEKTIVDEVEVEIQGVLVGILPVARRFEFHLEDTQEIISGPIDARLSTDFLERIEKDEQFVGRHGVATVRVKKIRRPDGREKIEYILTGISDNKK